MSRRLVVLVLLAAGLACARATSATPSAARARVAPAADAALCPPASRDTLGGRTQYVAYILDGVVLQPYVRHVVRDMGPPHGPTLDTLPEISALKEHDIVEVDVARGNNAVTRYGVCAGLEVVAITTKRSTRETTPAKP